MAEPLAYELPLERPHYKSWFGEISIALFFFAVALGVFCVHQATAAYIEPPGDPSFWNKLCGYGVGLLLLAGFASGVAGVIRSTNRQHSLVGLVLNSLGIMLILAAIFNR